MATKSSDSTPSDDESPTKEMDAKEEKTELDMFDLDPNYMQWSEALKARLFGTADKDGNYFSYLFLDKIFGESRPCKNCGARGGARLPDTENSLKLYVIEEGIIGKHNIQCAVCKQVEIVVSGDDPSLLPTDSRLEITGAELRELCKKVTHFEVLHDLMEMLQIAAIEDKKSRNEKHYSIAAFMIKNVRCICEEWCRPENADLRQRKFLRLREETLLTKYKPTFTPDTTEEYREMYDMMAQSFRENREKMQRLLYLMKAHLIDNPSRSSFMTWVGIAMMQSENYDKFKKSHDPKCFMKLESKEFQNLKDNYLSLDVPLGVKKIPVVFMLFEVPRFYYYADFLNQRLGKKRSKFMLTDKEREEVEMVKGEYSMFGMGRAGRRHKKKTMISPEAHLNFLSQQEEKDRERLYQNCRDKRKKESHDDTHKQKAKSKLPIKDSPHEIDPPDSPLLSPPGDETPGNGDQKHSAGDASEEGLTKAQLKRRKKKALMAQKKEESEGADREDSERVSSGKSEDKDEELMEPSEEVRKRNEEVNRANDKKEVKVEVAAKDPAVELKVEEKEKEEENAVEDEEEEMPVKKETPSLLEGSDDEDFFDDFGSAQDLADLDNLLIEAAKAALVKKKAARGECTGDYTSNVDPKYKENVEELAEAFATSSLFRDEEDDDDGTAGLERFVASPSPFQLPKVESKPALESEENSEAKAQSDSKRNTESSSHSSSSKSSSSGPKKSVLAKALSKMSPKTVSKYTKSGSRGGRRLPKFESDLAKSLQGVPSVKATSGILGSVPSAASKSASSGASGSGERLPRKIVLKREDTPVVMGDEAYNAYLKGGDDCPVKFMSSEHVPKTARPKMSDDQVDAMMKDFSNLSYPVLANLVGRPEEKEKEEKKKMNIPDFNRLISVLADPFGLSRNHMPPRKGALVFFLKEESKVRVPVDKKTKSVPEDATRRLQELVNNASKKVLDSDYECNFRLMEYHKLPAIVRKMAAHEKTGTKLETTEISGREYRELLSSTKHHGKKMFYKVGEPVARLVVLCLPMELGMAAEALIGLGRDILRVPDEDSAEVTYKRDSLSESDSDSSSTTGGSASKSDMPVAKSRNASRRARREAVRNARKALQNPNEHHSVMVTQMDAETLRRQGYKVKDGAEMATVLANKEGIIFHVMDGEQTPEEVREILAKKYTLVSEKHGHGYFTIPTKDHPGGLLVDPKITGTASEDLPKDRFQGNRKKLKSKKKAIQDIQYSSLHRWPATKSKNPYADALGDWAVSGGDWPEGLPHGIEDFGDREVACGQGDNELVRVLDQDQFGNHSMLKRLELNTVDAPNEAAAETVMKRYMEPADLGPGIDPKVPRYIIPSNGGPASNKKLPLGTKREDVPILMKYAAPHGQMRALDALKMPYKYELTQILTPHVDEYGDPVPDVPKRIAILSKLTLLPKSRYDSKQFEMPTAIKGKEEEEEEERKAEEDKLAKKKEREEAREKRRLAREEEKRLKEEERQREKERREMEEKEEDDDMAPKLSKSKRKKLKKKMKELEAKEKEGEGEDDKEQAEDAEMDISEEVRSKPDMPKDDGDVEMMEPIDEEKDDADSSSSGETGLPLVAREKFRYCENCNKKIDSRIQLCAGCKKVAYCNYRCQKASWKVHKKVCAYALRKDGKESTG